MVRGGIPPPSLVDGARGARINNTERATKERANDIWLRCIHGRRSPKSIKRGRGGQDSFLSLHRITWAVHPSLTVASDIRDYGPPQQPPGIIDPRRDTSRGYINRVLPLSIFRFRTVCLSGDNESTPHPCVDSSQPVEICDASLLPSHPRVRSDGNTCPKPLIIPLINLFPSRHSSTWDFRLQHGARKNSRTSSMQRRRDERLLSLVDDFL